MILSCLRFYHILLHRQGHRLGMYGTEQYWNISEKGWDILTTLSLGDKELYRVRWKGWHLAACSPYKLAMYFKLFRTTMVSMVQKEQHLWFNKQRNGCLEPGQLKKRFALNKTDFFTFDSFGFYGNPLYGFLDVVLLVVWVFILYIWCS